MNEYQVIITCRDNRGLFPDFFGKTEMTYLMGNSAKEVEKYVRKEMQDRLGYELHSGMSYSLNIKKL